MTDNRKPYQVTLPHREVVQAIEHPYADNYRFYFVKEKVFNEKGEYAGWRFVSKGYRHSTSAFATLGRLVQKDTKPQNQ